MKHPLLFACLVICPHGPLLAATPGNPHAKFLKSVQMDITAIKPAEIKGGDYDDKQQKIGVRVKFTNNDYAQSFEGYTATISAIGESVNERRLKKVLMQENVPITIAPRKTMEHKCPEVITRFDKTGLAFGYFYDGWVATIKDASGKVIYAKTSRYTAWEKTPDKVGAIAGGKCYNMALDEVKEP